MGFNKFILASSCYFKVYIQAKVRPSQEKKEVFIICQIDYRYS